MRFLGIDFGTRKAGLAISDEEGRMAFPLCVVEVDSSFPSYIRDVVVERGVGAIVIGDSRDFHGEENPLMKSVHAFRRAFEKLSDTPINLEPEVLSSKEAARLQGYVKKLDASAAAIILQSFLDKQHNREVEENVYK